MELINATRMAVGHTLAMEPSGRESLLVVIKGTFRLPADDGQRVHLLDEQLPLNTSDVFLGLPGLSAPQYECDFTPRKHSCDVLLNGQAHAPDGRPVARVTVGLAVGRWSKSFSVVGDRSWFFAGGARATDPVPFTTMPLSYDRAFGGTDMRHEDPAQHAAYLRNPSGRGYHRHLNPDWLEGSPLPNTEELGAEVQQPDGVYQPMAFGPIGRHWEPRYRYAGTYDQHWIDEVAPFLPSDFNESYYQSAPLDQQLPGLIGEQDITLLNLTPDGRRTFRLPHFTAPVYLFPKKGRPEDLPAQLDTVVIEPDLERIMMIWRASRPLRKDLFEIAQVLVGRKGPQWWADREELASLPGIAATESSEAS